MEAHLDDKHTKGRWDAKCRYAVGREPPISWDERQTITVFAEGGQGTSAGDVCYVSPANRDDSENIANANLIAAAPELLVALERLAIHDRAADDRAGRKEGCLELQIAEELINKLKEK